MPPPHSAIASRRICHPLFGGDVTQGGENPLRQTMDPPLPPEFRPGRDEISRRIFATIPAADRRAAVAYGRTARGLGWAKWPRPLARTAGEQYRRKRPAINCQKFTALCIFNRRGERALSAPAKPASWLARADKGFWDDCPLPWPIVRMAGAAAR